ncbi:hypothetical protein ACROYT_G000689 [Oculina patagonica]
MCVDVDIRSIYTPVCITALLSLLTKRYLSLVFPAIKSSSRTSCLPGPVQTLINLINTFSQGVDLLRFHGWLWVNAIPSSFMPFVRNTRRAGFIYWNVLDP